MYIYTHTILVPVVPHTTFSTSERQKVVRTCGALYILTWKCASRQNGVHFFNISTSKSGRNIVCFVHFDLEMCLASQRRALFRHLNFQKWSDVGVFCTFWLGNVLRATTACNCSSLIWPAGSAPAALARLLSDPPEPQIIGKTQWIAHLHLLSSDFLPLWSSPSLIFSSLTLPTPAFPSLHIVGSLTSKLPSTMMGMWWDGIYKYDWTNKVMWSEWTNMLFSDPWGGMESAISEQPTLGWLVGLKFELPATFLVLTQTHTHTHSWLTRRSKAGKYNVGSIKMGETASNHVQGKGWDKLIRPEHRKIAARLHASTLKAVLVSRPWTGSKPWNGTVALGSSWVPGLSNRSILKSWDGPMTKIPGMFFRVVFSKTRHYEVRFATANRVIPNVWRLLWPIDLCEVEWDCRTFDTMN